MQNTKEHRSETCDSETETLALLNFKYISENTCITSYQIESFALNFEIEELSRNFRTRAEPSFMKMKSACMQY